LGEKRSGERFEFGTAIISLKYCEFPDPLTYEQLIEEITRLTG